MHLGVWPPWARRALPRGAGSQLLGHSRQDPSPGPQDSMFSPLDKMLPALRHPQVGHQVGTHMLTTQASWLRPRRRLQCGPKATQETESLSSQVRAQQGPAHLPADPTGLPGPRCKAENATHQLKPSHKPPGADQG